MKAFLIVPNNAPSKNGMLVSTLSAFVSIDSIGIAEDAGEAIDIIQQRHPNVVIFNSFVNTSTLLLSRQQDKEAD